MSEDVDSFEFMQDCLVELKSIFDVAKLNREDPQTIIKISTEVRGLHLLLQAVDPDRIKNKNVKFKVSKIIREIEEDETIPKDIKRKVIDKLKDIK